MAFSDNLRPRTIRKLIEKKAELLFDSEATFCNRSLVSLTKETHFPFIHVNRLVGNIMIIQSVCDWKEALNVILFVRP